jgi:hypothetical protein
MNEYVISFWQSLATASISIVVTLVGFWVGIGRKLTSRPEIAEMIKNESPYMQDRQFIMERLAANKENHHIITNMLQKNTEVMHELKIQIVSLTKTLEALEHRIEKK